MSEDKALREILEEGWDAYNKELGGLEKAITAIRELIPKRRKCQCDTLDGVSQICWCGADGWNDCIAEMERRIKEERKGEDG